MKLGLALAGGGIRGIAHVGVIKALEENNIKIDYIGGTSSGSMIAALYGLGFSADEIHELFKRYASTIVKLNRNVIRKEIKNFIFYRKVFAKGINNGEFIEKIFNKLAIEKGINKLSDIKMPIVMPAVDISKSEKILFTSMNLSEKNYISNIDIGKAVRASCSFPIIYEPTVHEDKILLDGGVMDNIPVKEVKTIGANKVIAIKFDSDKIDSKSNAIDIIMKVSDIMCGKIAQNDIENSDFIIEVPTDGTGIIDVSKIDYCFQSGYKTTLKYIEEIRNL